MFPISCEFYVTYELERQYTCSPGNKFVCNLQNKLCGQCCLSQVPQAIKDHYNCPPYQLLPEHIKKMQEPLPLHSLPLNTPTSEEQEEVRFEK